MALLLIWSIVHRNSTMHGVIEGVPCKIIQWSLMTMNSLIQWSLMTMNTPTLPPSLSLSIHLPSIKKTGTNQPQGVTNMYSRVVGSDYHQADVILNCGRACEYYVSFSSSSSLSLSLSLSHLSLKFPPMLPLSTVWHLHTKYGQNLETTL